MNCDRCMPKICDADEKKREEPPTRRLDRVSGSAPKPPELGFGWKRDTIDYGDDGMATIYTQGDAFRAGAEYMRRSAQVVYESAPYCGTTIQLPRMLMPDALRIDDAAAGYVEGLGR